MNIPPASRPAQHRVLRMGRIGYLNVLPIYHPLEAGILPHDYELVSGPPALAQHHDGAGRAARFFLLLL